MQQIKLLNTLILAFAVLTLTACASNKPISEWHRESFTGTVDNILIIGVSSNADRRYTFENKFISALAASNTSAISSRRLLPSSLNLTREIVEKAIEGRQVGAVLITRLVGVQEKEIYRLPDDYVYEDSYLGFYDLALQETNRGSYEEQTLLTLETRLYDVASGKLIWSMRSAAMDATKTNEIIDDQIEFTTKSLASYGLIAKP